MEWLIAGIAVFLVWSATRKPTQQAILPSIQPMTAYAFEGGPTIAPAVAQPTQGSGLPLPLTILQQPTPTPTQPTQQILTVPGPPPPIPITPTEPVAQLRFTATPAIVPAISPVPLPVTTSPVPVAYQPAPITVVSPTPTPIVETVPVNPLPTRNMLNLL